MENIITLTVEQLAFRHDALGQISLIGDADGRSLITGNIEPSNVIPGTHLIETEHGTIYLEDSYTITVELG